ncbi:hypothetical protein GCM10020367_35940 [Streptomyces sannanensis]|uniref:Spore-associated protein A n=1 Tax=Streptomyces sannanensis TaxID=285536 RepID=A0ABP6SD99_9ACTN
MLRRLGQRLAVVAASVAGLAALTITPAHAVTPSGLCGTGYSQIDSHVFTNGSVEFARIYLLYNTGNGYNCVVTLHSSATGGMPLTTGAWLDVANDGKGQAKDQSVYSSYAGPVRLYAGNTCVRWGGMIEAGVSTFTYTSPWEHCG